jgi:hypothetical protein
MCEHEIYSHNYNGKEYILIYLHRRAYRLCQKHQQCFQMGSDIETSRSHSGPQIGFDILLKTL